MGLTRSAGDESAAVDAYRASVGTGGPPSPSLQLAAARAWARFAAERLAWEEAAGACGHALRAATATLEEQLGLRHKQIALQEQFQVPAIYAVDTGRRPTLLARPSGYAAAMLLAEPWIDRYSAPFWAVVGVVATVIVGYIFWKLTDKNARLDWCIQEQVPVLNTSIRGIANVTSGSDVRVMYKDKQVEDPHIVQVRVMNTGKVSFNESDFKQPIRVEFGGMSYLSSVLAPSATGMTLTIAADPEEKKFYEVVTDLLKPGEWLDLRFLFDGDPEVEVTTRMDKIKDIRQVASLERLTIWEILKSITASIRVEGLSLSVELPTVGVAKDDGKRR